MVVPCYEVVLYNLCYRYVYKEGLRFFTEVFMKVGRSSMCYIMKRWRYILIYSQHDTLGIIMLWELWAFFFNDKKILNFYFLTNLNSKPKSKWNVLWLFIKIHILYNESYFSLNIISKLLNICLWMLSPIFLIDFKPYHTFF
jgi:hypothetical protein